MIFCPYCQNQGRTVLVHELVTRDDKPEPTKKPGMVRVGCRYGHKFAVPKK